MCGTVFLFPPHIISNIYSRLGVALKPVGLNISFTSRMGTKKGQVSYSAPLQPRYPCFGQDLGDWEGAGRVGLTRLQRYCFFPN